MSNSSMAAGTPDSNLNDRLEKERELQVAARNGANWFFWIAGLAVINSVTSLINVNGMPNYVFVLTGLLGGNTAIGIAVILGIGQWGPAVNLIVQSFNFALAILFAIMGRLARKQQRWVFIVALAFFAVDSVMTMIYGDLIGLAIHGVALWACGKDCRR